jgi:hypothetical protein
MARPNSNRRWSRIAKSRLTAAIVKLIAAALNMLDDHWPW